MFRLFLRGALIVLPVFFCAMLEARSVFRPVEYYRIFYEPIGFFSSWAHADRSERSKDLFLARYHLPLKGRSAVVVPTAPRDSLGNNGAVYLPVHLDVPVQRTVTFVLDGAEKGTLSVNGERKGLFDLQGTSGYVEVRISFAPGVYALLFSIEKRRAALPLLLVADQSVTLSSRGFTKNFSAAVSLSVKELSDGVLHDRLWATHCLPAPADEERFTVAWRAAFGGESVPSFDEKKTPLLLLLRYSANDTARSILLKVGFTDEMLAWWRERIFRTEVCHDRQKN